MQRKQQRQDLLDETELKLEVEWVRSTSLIGWVSNIKVFSYFDESEKEYSSLLIFVVQENGMIVKTILDRQPYFYIEVSEQIEDVIIHLENRFEKQVSNIKEVQKIDLEQVNHLAGLKKSYIKLSFRTIQDLVSVRYTMKHRIEQNQIKKMGDILDNLIDIREYDVPYHCRVCIDTGLRCGKWFQFAIKERKIESFQKLDRLALPELRYISFDIETSKQPLKFPDSKHDKIVMISLTYDEKSLLITNKEFMPVEVVPFDYAPKPEFATKVEIYNEPEEKSVLIQFFQLLVDYKPQIITSFNGDRFDWPFIEERCYQNNLNLEKEIGIKKQDETQEYFGRFMIHLDCFPWVERDAYLPQGSHGLKAVTRAKLSYEPIEVDPEQMMKMAFEEGQKFAEYSISDSVATYWLYKKHIHDFILALCTIIPLSPDEVLRKGSGTLCECLLMAQAYNRNIIFPNKKLEPVEKFYQGHLLDSETYIGGKVECLRSGIYRSDIDVEFKIDKECLMSMWQGAEQLIKFVGKIENQEFNDEDIDECAKGIREKLDAIISKGDVFKEKPLIYHLDVAAMYPNIILTNRLQPVSIVDNRICSGCVFNTAENKCKRDLEWQWKVEYFPLQRNEYENVKMQLDYEIIQQGAKEFEERGFDKSKYVARSLKNLPVDQQQKLIKQRVRTYTQKIYKQYHQNQTILKKDTVCMRENDFYVSTVRDFRDRRYEFKENVKIFKARADEAKKAKLPYKEFQDRVALFESLQLAHKILLNSFYGYVMRRGARWYSMQMAGIVTHLGSQIISTAKQMVDQIGLPLELDTDGIWCLLPAGFPEDFTIKNKYGKAVKFSYPCFILNELIYDKYKNNQYQWIRDEETLEYGMRDEMSIFFEVDGPYKCMVIPAAREENKQLKKRYVVFNKNGTIAEIKGFEIKRRGELKIIKAFQQEIFNQFLKGTTLSECYKECGLVASKWLNILIKCGDGLEESKLFEYIGESRVLSKDINEYNAQKGVAITAGKRMGEFLGGDQMKGGGLNCLYIICKFPIGQPLNERSVPVILFESKNEVKVKFLRKWFKEPLMKEEDLVLSKIVDWDYYIERLGNTIQKILVIPAALQKVQNPVPEVNPPEWLNKRLREQMSGLFQTNLKTFFKTQNPITQQYAKLRHQPVEQEEQNTAKKRREQTQSQQQLSQISEPETIITHDMDVDFRRFFKQQQKLWTDQLKNKNKTHKNTGNIRNLFSNMQNIIESSIWQILQINEIKPGFFQVWILLENGMITQETIEIRRVLYVNSYKKEPKQQIVKKQLPREKQARFLYVINMTEEEFQIEYGYFSQFLANPDYEGIYEHKVPLLFKFITELGNMCKIKKSSLQEKNKVKKYTFDDLQPVFELGKNQKYLQSKESYLLANFMLIQQYVYKEGYQIWMVSFQDFYTAYVVSKSKKNVDNLKIIIKQAAQVYTDNPKVRSICFESITDVYMAIQTFFDTLAPKPQLVIIQTQHDIQNLQSQGMQFLIQEAPTIQIAPIKEVELKLSAIDWDQKILKYILQESQNIPSYIKQLISFSRYSCIPLCNINMTNSNTISNTQLDFSTDVLYQRAMKTAFNSISWYGQGLNRDNRDIVAQEYNNSQTQLSGIYMNYCVEIDILHLQLNTIALSDELKNVDKEASSLIGKADMLENLDELVGAKTAFKILKNLVVAWLEDALTFNNEISDLHLQNIICWIYSDKSPLYDPYLGKILKRLSIKLFGHLTQKLIQLGAKIIYASFSKIIISTGKQTLEKAQNYTVYILETLVQNPLFKYIILKPQKYFTGLIFKDCQNYIGYVSDTETNQKNIDYRFKYMEFLPLKLQDLYSKLLFEILIKTEQYKEKVQLEIHTLPQNLQIQKEQNLETITLNFMISFIDSITQDKIYNAVKIYQENFRTERKNYEKHLEQLPQLDQLKAERKKKLIIEDEEQEQQEVENSFRNDEDYEKDSFLQDDEEIINYQEESEQFIDERKMNDQDDLIEDETVEENYENFGKNFEQQWMMQPVIGSQFEVKSDDPGILRMITYCTEMLSVNEDVQIVMKKIKGNSCKLLQVSEYAQSSQFVEPCLNMVINNVVCYKCYNVADFNIFKEEWQCNNCSEPFELMYLQDRICSYLENQILYYQIQDLQCIKCKQVQEYPWQERCNCSGHFQIRKDQFEDCFNKLEFLKYSLLLISEQKSLKKLKCLLNSIQ